MMNVWTWLKDRFRKIDRDEWIVLCGILVVFALLLYFSIGMSISVSKGWTLFGEASAPSDEMEIEGPTSWDLMILSLFWILTALILALFVYRLFFRKIEKKKVVHKVIVHGQTVVSKEKDEEDEQGRTGEQHSEDR